MVQTNSSRESLQLFSFFFQLCRKEGNVLLNDALNIFYLQLYGVEHMVNHNSDSKSGNPLPPLHELLIPISNKGSFICTYNGLCYSTGEVFWGSVLLQCIIFKHCDRCN